MSTQRKPCLLLYCEAPVRGGTTNGLDLILRGFHVKYRIVCAIPRSLRESGWPAFDEREMISDFSILAPGGLSVRRFWPWVRSRLQFALLLHRVNPTIAHFHLHTPFACRGAVILVKILTGAKVVVTEQYLSQIRFLRHRARSLPAQLVRELLIWWNLTTKRIILLFVDRTLLVSTDDRAFFVDKFGQQFRDRSIVIFNAVRLELGRAGEKADVSVPPGFFLVLTTAELNNQKGHRYLLEAIPGIISEVPNTVFLLAGDGHLRQELEQLTSTLKIGDHVCFLGRRPDVPGLLQVADLVVLPSLFEGLPFALLEAMAAGKPIVATDVPGNRDAVVNEETGLLVEPMNPKALSSAIVRLLKNDKLRGEMGQSGKERAIQVFDEREICSMIDGVYLRLVNGC